MTQELLRQLGDMIRRAREKRGLSQEQLAGIIGASRPSLSAYEKGRTQPPLDVVTAIIKALQTDFRIDGLVIGRQETSAPQARVDQLCFEFGAEHVYDDATVRITPSKDLIVITTVFSQARKVS